jgi:UPF0755 protein
MRYHYSQRTRRQRLEVFLIICSVIVIALVLATIVVRHRFDNDLRAVNNQPQSKIVNIAMGMSVNQIADLLHADNLIRSSWAFEWYVRANNVNPNLEAGTYALASDQTTPSIVSILTKGKVATKLVTIIPGQRLDQVKADLINDGFSPAAVNQALQPDQYANLPALADKPPDASLEGLLYPDSFQKTADTEPSVIIQESITEMGHHLTPALQAALTQEGLTTYQGIILASIVESEVSNPSDQTQAAQVFLKRLSANMPLGSDVTAYYGSIINGLSPSLTYDSPYNTLLHTGLPPTPISMVNNQALEAVAHPAATSWLYFVTGDNGVTYFSQTAQQQQANTAMYCHKLCSQ